MFPRHIAEALKAGLKPEIEHKANVCVLFADIPAFEQHSRSMTPEQVADLLDRYLSRLDVLVQTFELYKASSQLEV